MKKELEKIFKALGNSKRLEIISLLSKNKRLSVGEIAYEISLSFRSVSKHLAVLTKAGITENSRGGMSVYYEVARSARHPLREFLRIVCKECR